MKTCITQGESFQAAWTLAQNELEEMLIVNTNTFYDKHSEKYTLVICYYE